MAYTQEDILAKTFFKIADNIQQTSQTEIAESISTFQIEDYASLVASVLDAAYWIIAGQLDVTEVDDIRLYVHMQVYSDMIYRGFDPAVSWEESGLMNQFYETETPSAKKSSSFSQGDYAQYTTSRGVRIGMITTANQLLCFDGVLSSTKGEKLEKITCEAALNLLTAHSDSITTTVRGFNHESCYKGCK